MRKSDKILIIVALTVIAFIITCFVFSWWDKIIPPELIIGFFGLISAECGFLSWIKTATEKNEKVNTNKPKGKNKK